MAHKLSDAQGQLSRAKKAVAKLTLTGPRTQHHVQTYLKCLDADKEEDSKLRRVTTGEKDPNMPNKTILLVGESGAGKSTLIDVMLNHLKGTKYEDNIRCKIVEEEGRSQAESQTTAITVYELFGLDNGKFPYSLTIIDTPGFGDTRGIDHDPNVFQTLHGLFIKEVGEIDAVALVLKEGTNRLTDRQSYIFNSVVSLFGKDIENNMVALITHSGGHHPQNALQALERAQIRIARNGKNKPIYFLFDNCQLKGEGEEGEEEEEEGEELSMKHAWDTSECNMKKLFDFLTEVKPQNLKQTAEVLTRRIQIEAKVNEQKQRIHVSTIKENMARKNLEDVKKFQHEADKAKKTTTYEEEYKELETIGDWWDNKATRCTICEENCHFPGCTWAWDASWCLMMENGRCTICPGKCEASSHVRDKSRYVIKTRVVTKTVGDLQKMYKINEKNGKPNELLEAIQKDVEKRLTEKKKLIEDIYQTIIPLYEIALKGDSLSIYPHLEFLIEKFKETGNDERVKEMMVLKNRIEAEAPGGLNYLLANKQKIK